MNEHRKPRSRIAIVALILALGALGLAAMTYVAVEGVDTKDKLETSQGDLQTSERDKERVEGQADQKADRTLELCSRGDKLAKMLRQAGECSAAAQLREVVEGPPGAPGAQGIPGAPGIPGVPGPKGERGEPGRTPPCLAEPAGCRGQDGADGAPGEPGASGPQGEPGAPGPAGQDGTDGTDGQPPASWTWTDPSPGGKTYTCTRDADSPDSAPTYTCAAA